MKKGFRGYFITGVLVVVPLYIAVYVVFLIVGFMDNILKILPAPIHPDTYLPFHVPGIGIIFTVAAIFIVGVFAKNFFGRAMIRLTERFMARLPVIRMIYNASKQFLETFFSGEHEGFKKVVLVEFPKKGTYSMGFMTGAAKGEIKEKTGLGYVSVFVPTTPNPTSGFYVIVHESEVVLLDMTVEDAFKVIMTGGLVVPAAGNAVKPMDVAAGDRAVK
ncbi:MAG: DUF502 domain-containing protein [Deltaproteobacteria bacterium]